MEPTCGWEPEDLDHSVTLVGYGRSDRGMDYWHIRRAAPARAPPSSSAVSPRHPRLCCSFGQHLKLGCGVVEMLTMYAAASFMYTSSSGLEIDVWIRQNPEGLW